MAAASYSCCTVQQLSESVMRLLLAFMQHNSGRWFDFLRGWMLENWPGLVVAVQLRGVFIFSSLPLTLGVL